MRNILINLKKVSKSNIYIFVIFGISFLLMSFTLFDKIAWGNDYPFHIANIMSLDNNIKPSIFDFVFSKITNIAGYGLGYGTYIFYPVLSHLFTAYIFIFTKIVGLNLPQTMELVKMLVLFLSGLSMFFLAKKISNSKEVGLISAISYMCAPFFLSDIYVRCAFAEIFTFIFMPIILNGLYELIYGNSRKFCFYFTFGYIGLMFSHLVLAVYFSLFVILFLLFNIKTILIKDRIIALILSSVFILLITSSFYVPMLEHKFSGDYVVFQKDSMTNDFPIQSETLSFSDFFAINTDGTHSVRFGFNIVMLFFLLIVLFNYNSIFRNNKIKKIINFLLVVSLIFLIMISSLFPWDKMPNILQMIQFPWRLLSFVILCFSIIAGFIVFVFPKSQQKLVIFMSVILLSLTGLYSIPTENLSPPNLPSDMNEWGMGAQHEYLPINAKENEDHLKSRGNDIVLIKGKANINVINNDIPNLKSQIELKSNKVTLELPRIYYLGYNIELITDKGISKVNYKENEKGMIEIVLNDSGVLIVTYTGTKLDIICDIVSFASFICAIIFFIYSYRKDKVLVERKINKKAKFL